MLTRLRVEGFKNLLDIDIRFGPLTCIAGTNGAGKSNIFDAIRFLHLLAGNPIMEAVQKLRETSGLSREPHSLFAAFGEFRSDEIRLVADLIIQRKTEDVFGVTAEASISTVQYTVAFHLNEEEKPGRLELAYESLLPTPLAKARKETGFKRSPAFNRTAITGRRTVPFISTKKDDGKAQIRVHQEGHGGRLVPAPRSSWTALGGLASSDFPTVLAVQSEMKSWQSLLLEPSAMRSASSYQDPKSIDYRGANLPSTIERLRRSERKPGQVYASIENRLADLIEDVREIRIADDDRTETYTVEVQTSDKVFHPARSLSDGTLRFIVLATLVADPLTTGLLCLEEPENGIHPQRVAAMIDLLREIACDPSHEVGPENPLRQVIINTHSSAVISSVEPEDLVYIETQKISRSGHEIFAATPLVMKDSWRHKIKPERASVAPGHLHPYFPNADELWTQLELDFSLG